MGIILEFRRAAEPTPRAIEPEDCVLGHVIIFPGVRIERRSSEESPSGKTSPPRKRVQRARKKQR